jgi:hypothetical protein
VLRAPGETETTQENIQDWLELGEGDPGVQLLTEEEIAAVIFFIYFHHQHYIIITFSIYLFSKFLGLHFFTNPDYLLIRINEGLRMVSWVGRERT